MFQSFSRVKTYMSSLIYLYSTLLIITHSDISENSTQSKWTHIFDVFCVLFTNIAVNWEKETNFLIIRFLHITGPTDIRWHVKKYKYALIIEYVLYHSRAYTYFIFLTNLISRYQRQTIISHQSNKINIC